MPLDDIEVLVVKNLSTINISDFNSSNVSCSKAQAEFSYPANNSRVVHENINFHAAVYDDTFHLEMNFQAKMMKGRSPPTYKVKVVVD